MKNLNYINTVEIDEYDAMRAAKRNPSRDRLNDIRDSINENYNEYLYRFNTIHNIIPCTYEDLDKGYLKDCYKGKTIPLEQLLKKIIDAQSLEFKHTCPYCQLMPRTTFDHYIPETSYPEYSVLSRNLIPCCTYCNPIKNDYWRANNHRTIIHYYNDFIPDTQFLYGSMNFRENLPSITYRIENITGINPTMYSIIEKHFERLRLTTLYESYTNVVISDIIDDVEANRFEFADSLSAESISRIILFKSNKNKVKYGINYWKSIAMDVLANSEQFINQL